MRIHHSLCDVMTSSNGNIFRVIGPLCGEFTGHRWTPPPPPQRPVMRSPWINGWVNNLEAGDLRRHRSHYDVTVMNTTFSNRYALPRVTSSAAIRHLPCGTRNFEKKLLNKKLEWNIQDCVIFQYFVWNIPPLPGYPSLHCKSMVILCEFNNSLLTWRKMFDWSPNNILSPKTKWRNGVTQGALSCYLISYRKSASFV